MNFKDRIIVTLVLINPCLYSNGWIYRTIVKLCRLDCECCSYFRAMFIGWVVLNILASLVVVSWKSIL